MKSLLYANDQNSFLVYEAWEIIGYENKASLSNLITLITCIENILLQKNVRLMSTIQTSINDSLASSSKRKFGHIKDDVFYLASETELKKIVTYFKPLVDVRKIKENELIK